MGRLSMNHFFDDVPGLGNVVLTRHAQDKARQEGISTEEIERALVHGHDTPDGMDITWREYKGLRLVVLLNPTPNRGAKVVKTLFRVKPSYTAR
jgi:transcriptional/translational regulatory protein YebC/TACO1